MRLLGNLVTGDTWVIITPDEDIYEEQMSQNNPDFTSFVYGGPGLGGGVPHGVNPADVYGFRALTAARYNSWWLRHGSMGLDWELQWALLHLWLHHHLGLLLRLLLWQTKFGFPWKTWHHMQLVMWSFQKAINCHLVMSLLGATRQSFLFLEVNQVLPSKGSARVRLDLKLPRTWGCCIWKSILKEFAAETLLRRCHLCHMFQCLGGDFNWKVPQLLWMSSKVSAKGGWLLLLTMKDGLDQAISPNQIVRFMKWKSLPKWLKLSQWLIRSIFPASKGANCCWEGGNLSRRLIALAPRRLTTVHHRTSWAGSWKMGFTKASQSMSPINLRTKRQSQKRRGRPEKRWRRENVVAVAEVVAAAAVARLPPRTHELCNWGPIGPSWASVQVFRGSQFWWSCQFVVGSKTKFSCWWALERSFSTSWDGSEGWSPQWSCIHGPCQKKIQKTTG